MFEIDEKLLNAIAQEEVKSLLEGLKDPELRHDPRFLDKVRKFLKDNNLLVSPDTAGVKDLRKEVINEPIPVFNDLVKDGTDASYN